MNDDISARAQHKREVRSFTIDDLECREDSRNGSITFEGVASVVGVAYGVRDQFGEYEETIREGAFRRTLSHGHDVRLLKNHDPAHVFARTKSGTMDLFDDPHLRVVAPSLDPANPAVQILRSELSRGDIDQMSIGFKAKNQEWSEDYSERTITEAALSEISIVAFPASPTTSASVRSLDVIVDEIKAGEYEADELLRAMAMLKGSMKVVEVDYNAEARRRLRRMS